MWVCEHKSLFFLIYENNRIPVYQFSSAASNKLAPVYNMWLYFPISLPQFYPHVPPQILSFHERLQFVGPQLGTVIFLILECQTSPNLQQVELLHLLWAHRGCRTETAVKTLNLKMGAGREVLWEPADSIAQRFITNTQVITLAQEECVNYIF